MRTGAFFAMGLVAAVGIAAAAGCSSKSSSSSSQSQDQQDLQAAHDYYVSHVHPSVTSCIGCHAPAGAGPTFMDQDADASYNAIAGSVGLIAAPKNSPLVTYVHMDKAVVESPEQRNVIAVWMGLEANARHLDGAVPKPATITDAYKQFADCMNFEVWEYYRMGDLPFTETDMAGPCLGCHSTGQGSAFLSADSRSTFTNSKQFPFIQKLVVGQLDSKGNFLALVPSNRFIDKADEGCMAMDQTTCHPRYGLPPVIISDIQGFVSTTLQDLATDTCGSNIVVPQAEAGPVDAGGG